MSAARAASHVVRDDPTPLDHDDRCAFALLIDRACQAVDANRSALAHRWGLTEQTVRRWHEEQSSPAFERLLPIARRMTIPELLDLLRTIGGSRVLVIEAPATRVDATQLDPKALRTIAIGVAVNSLELVKLIDAIARDDGRITPDDAASIATAADTIRVALDRVTRIAQLAAERAAGRGAQGHSAARRTP